MTGHLEKLGIPGKGTFTSSCQSIETYFNSSSNKMGKKSSHAMGKPPKKFYGINKSCNNITKKFSICPALQQFTGTKEAYIGQVVAGIWRYIKAKGLQCEGRGRFFKPDERLATVLGNEGKDLDGFKMMSYLKNHFQFGKH